MQTSRYASNAKHTDVAFSPVVPLRKREGKNNRLDEMQRRYR